MVDTLIRQRPISKACDNLPIRLALRPVLNCESERGESGDAAYSDAEGQRRATARRSAFEALNALPKFLDDRRRRRTIGSDPSQTFALAAQGRIWPFSTQKLLHQSLPVNRFRRRLPECPSSGAQRSPRRPRQAISIELVVMDERPDGVKVLEPGVARALHDDG